MQRELEEIEVAAERAASLTRHLVAFSRQQVLQKEPLDLNELVLGLQRMIERFSGEHIEVLLNLAAQLDPIHADRESLEGVLLNLVANARDAMPDGGRLRSAVGQGTEFRIEQPCAPPEVAAEHERPALAFEALGLGHHKLLVVDDDELVRTAVTRQLEALGMSVDAVGSGAAAIDYLGSGNHPDAMLLDLSMPRMSGEQTLRVIRERFPRLPVAIMTGYAQDHSELGSDIVVLTKPFPLGALANGLYNLLRPAGP